MATARNLLGEQPEERLRVWYHNGEDPREEIDRRLVGDLPALQNPAGGIAGATCGSRQDNEFPLARGQGLHQPRSRRRAWCGRSPRPSPRTKSTSRCSIRS